MSDRRAFEYIATRGGGRRGFEEGGLKLVMWVKLDSWVVDARLGLFRRLVVLLLKRA